MNENKVVSKSDFGKKHSSSLNLWHWSNLLVIAAILITVLLVKTIFSGKENSPLVQSALEKKGVLINLEQAKAITKIYTHKLWDWHVYFGYVLSGLFLFRVLLEFFQLVDKKFFRIITNAQKLLKYSSDDKKKLKHFVIVRYIYLLFYSTLGLMAVTGLFIKFSDNYPNLKPIKEIVKDIHNIGMYIILAFIVTHLLGLFIYELGKKTESIE